MEHVRSVKTEAVRDDDEIIWIDHKLANGPYDRSLESSLIETTAVTPTTTTATRSNGRPPGRKRTRQQLPGKGEERVSEATTAVVKQESVVFVGGAGGGGGEEGGGTTRKTSKAPYVCTVDDLLREEPTGFKWFDESETEGEDGRSSTFVTERRNPRMTGVQAMRKGKFGDELLVEWDPPPRNGSKFTWEIYHTVPIAIRDMFDFQQRKRLRDGLVQRMKEKAAQEEEQARQAAVAACLSQGHRAAPDDNDEEPPATVKKPRRRRDNLSRKEEEELQILEDQNTTPWSR